MLINNAALLIPAHSLTDVDEELADLAFSVNVKVPALLTAALVPAMVETGSAGASNNTPASSFDFGQGIFLTRTGVHRIRTITSCLSAKTQRHVRVA